MKAKNLTIAVLVAFTYVGTSMLSGASLEQPFAKGFFK